MYSNDKTIGFFVAVDVLLPKKFPQLRSCTPWNSPIVMSRFTHLLQDLASQPHLLQIA